jgi:hypothetical protein
MQLFHIPSFVINIYIYIYIRIFNQIKVSLRLLTRLFLYRSVLGEPVAAGYTYYAVRIFEINVINKFRLFF